MLKLELKRLDSMKDLILTQAVINGVRLNLVKNVITGKTMFTSKNIMECLDFMYIFSIAKDTPTYH